MGVLLFLMATAVFVPATFDFPGGTSAQLAQAMSEATGKPVALVDLGERRLRAARFRWGTPKEFGREARSYFGFRPITPDEDTAATLGFGAAWEEPFLNGEAAYPSGDLREKEDRVTTDGTTILTSARSVVGDELHWALREVPIALCVESATKAEVRAAVLTAVGADGKGQPRWPELRTRLADGFGQMAKAKWAKEEDPFAQKNGEPTWANVTEGIGLKSLAFRTLTDTQMKQAFAKEGDTLEVALPPTSPLAKEARNFFYRSISHGAEENPQRFQTPIGDIRDHIGDGSPIVFLLTSPTNWNMQIGNDHLRMEFALGQ